MSNLHVRTRFTPKIQTGNRYCVLLGHNGHGKTALKNKLCGTTHASKASSSSLTRNLFCNPVRVGLGSFNIIDTPGLGASVEVFKHAFLNYTALTTFDLNTVFIIAKYENRYDDICNNIDEAIGLFNFDQQSDKFRDYTKNIVLLVSHFDQAQRQAEEFASICEHLDQYGVFNVIAYSVEHDTEQLANAMFACVSNQPAVKIDVGLEQFLSSFPFNFRSDLLKIRQTFTRSGTSIAGILTQVLSIIHTDLKSVDAQDKDEWLQSLVVSHREMCQEVIDEFIAKNHEAMEDLNFYAGYIELQQKMLKQEERLVESVRGLMSYDITDPNHPKNMIKKCPHCGLIWWKVSGCDGVTTCGNRPTGDKERESVLLKGRDLFKFVFYWTDGPGSKVSVKKKTANTHLLVNQIDSTLDSFDKSPVTLDSLITTLSKLISNVSLVEETEVVTLIAKIKPFMQRQVIEVKGRSLSAYLTALQEFLVLFQANSSIGRMSLHESVAVKKQVQPVGCGKEFEWRKQLALGNDEWEAIMKITTIDSVKKIFEQDIGSQIKDFKQKVDVNFYQ